jgi:hypothetical protein
LSPFLRLVTATRAETWREAEEMVLVAQIEVTSPVSTRKVAHAEGVTLTLEIKDTGVSVDEVTLGMT